MTPEEFRAALKELGHRQVGFATGAGVSPTTVSRWAKGTQPIPGWVDLVLGVMKENAANRARLAAFGIPPAAPAYLHPQEADTHAL